MNDVSNAELDELLRRAFDGAVADDGFSTSVMRALPPRIAPAAGLLPAAALVGGVLTWLTLGPSPLLQDAAQQWLEGQAGTSLILLCAVALTMGVLACAWAAEEEP
jgi:hypothetical protein